MDTNIVLLHETCKLFNTFIININKYKLNGNYNALFHIITHIFSNSYKQHIYRFLSPTSHPSSRRSPCWNG